MSFPTIPFTLLNSDWRWPAYSRQDKAFVNPSSLVLGVARQKELQATKLFRIDFHQKHRKIVRTVQIYYIPTFWHHNQTDQVKTNRSISNTIWLSYQKDRYCRNIISSKERKQKTQLLGISSDRFFYLREINFLMIPNTISSSDWHCSAYLIQSLVVLSLLRLA